jgi:hypothetical protein
MKITIYILSLLFLYGCASIHITDASNEDRFSKFIGNKYQIKANAVICKNGYLGDSPKSAPGGNQLIFQSDCHGKSPLIVLAKGVEITITKAQIHKHFPPMWKHIYFIGSVDVGNDTEEKFYYFYGFDSDSVQGKLPW